MAYNSLICKIRHTKFALSMYLVVMIGLFYLYISLNKDRSSMSLFKKYTDTQGMASFSEEEINRLENGFTDQTHPRLMQWIRTNWIHPPSDKPLKLSHPEKKHFSQKGQDAQVDDILQNKRNGFFVECGGNNGESISNTLFFERERNWTGLLIEAEKKLFRILQTKNRKSFSINCCLNSKNTSGRVQFGVKGNMGFNAVADEKLPAFRYTDNQLVPVQCFTLYSLMKALNRTRIDFFSLDVEGAEIGILKTIPFNSLDIDILLIEYYVYSGSKAESQTKYLEIDDILKPKGYELLQKTWLDLLYRKKRTD